MWRKFYKSREWELFVKQLRLERTGADGVLLCEHCGQPILKAYDCIAHHIVELNEQNVNDVLVSLNPDNIILVHFRCHNEIHRRFGYSERVEKKVFIVWGSPCAGKREWIESVCDSNDLIVDINKLWSAIRGGGDKPNAIKQNVFALRDCLIDTVKVRRGRWNNAYIVGGYPLQGERERMAETLGAELIYIDTPREVCEKRAKILGGDMPKFVSDWWEKFSYNPPRS